MIYIYLLYKVIGFRYFEYFKLDYVFYQKKKKETLIFKLSKIAGSAAVADAVAVAFAVISKLSSIKNIVALKVVFRLINSNQI